MTLQRGVPDHEARDGAGAVDGGPEGGHRPGATQQQWAFARVNSFVTKSSGTWGGADKDLAKKVRGS